MNILKIVIKRVQACRVAAIQRFSNVHLVHAYYTVSDQRTLTGFRIIVERCAICGKMKDTLDC